MTPDAKREAVSYLQAAYGVSERRACSAMAVDRSTIRYESKRADDTELRDRLEVLFTNLPDLTGKFWFGVDP